MRLLPLLAVFALAACQPPAGDNKQAPPVDQPQITACNSVTPDAARQVSISEPTVSAALADLRGGPITPGTYDLVSATRVGAATGWTGTRAVSIEATESADGVTINWSGVDGSGQIDSWTALLTDSPDVRLTYSCGRVGNVVADYAADGATLNLRLTDGANGALDLVFQRRA